MPVLWRRPGRDAVVLDAGGPWAADRRVPWRCSTPAGRAGLDPGPRAQPPTCRHRWTGVRAEACRRAACANGAVKRPRAENGGRRRVTRRSSFRSCCPLEETLMPLFQRAAGRAGDAGGAGRGRRGAAMVRGAARRLSARPTGAVTARNHAFERRRPDQRLRTRSPRAGRRACGSGRGRHSGAGEDQLLGARLRSLLRAGPTMGRPSALA